MMMNVVFFFKQKTAYEMRISDWSSDVRSSDLDGRTENLNGGPDFDNVHQDSIRASLLVEPTDTIKSTTIFDYFRADERAGGLHLYRQQPGVLGAIFGSPALGDFLASQIANYRTIQKQIGRASCRERVCQYV